MSIYQRSLVVAIFTGAVAVGVHSARGQSIPGNAGNRPPIGVPGNMPPPPPPAQHGAQTAGMPTGLPNGTAQPLNIAPGNSAQINPGQMPQGLPDGLAPQGQTTGIAPGTMNNLPQGIPPQPMPSAQMPPGQPGYGTSGASSMAPASTPAAFAPSEVQVYTPPVAGNKTKTAILKTTMGDITIKLFPNEAPKTVKNFVDLSVGEKDFIDVKTSKKTRRPFYNGLTFHRVVKDFVIQSGCPFGNGRGGPGYAIEDEISPSLKFDKPGMVAMAPARKKDQKGTYEANSNGSQFFITLAPQPDFDGKFAIFGEVIKGMDVVKKISNVKTGPTDRPIRRVFLTSVEVPDHKPAATPTPIPVPETMPGDPQTMPQDPQALPPEAMPMEGLPAGPDASSPAGAGAPH